MSFYTTINNFNKLEYLTEISYQRPNFKNFMRRRYLAVDLYKILIKEFHIITDIFNISHTLKSFMGFNNK